MSRRHPLLLFPFNGNAVEALDCLDDRWDCVGFIDDDENNHGHSIQGVPVFDREALDKWPDAQVLAVPGSPSSYLDRQHVIEKLGISSERFARVIHTQAVISPQAKIGRNTLVMAGVVLTSNAVLGRHCCVLPNTVIHHDSRIGDWTLVGANVTVSGGTIIGENCYIGSASSIMNGLRIGDGVFVGFGANVIRDVDSGSCVVGNPARCIDKRKSTQ